MPLKTNGMLLCPGQLKVVFGKCMLIKRLWDSFKDNYRVLGG